MRPDRRLQLVGQGRQHLVELGVSQGLVLRGSPAPPQQPHLEVGQEELQDLGLLLETCSSIGRQENRWMSQFTDVP